MSDKHFKLTPEQQAVLFVIYKWECDPYRSLVPDEHPSLEGREYAPISPVPTYLVKGVLWDRQNINVDACLNALKKLHLIKKCQDGQYLGGVWKLPNGEILDVLVTSDDVYEEEDVINDDVSVYYDIDVLIRKEKDEHNILRIARVLDMPFYALTQIGIEQVQYINKADCKLNEIKKYLSTDYDGRMNNNKIKIPASIVLQAIKNHPDKISLSGTQVRDYLRDTLYMLFPVIDNCLTISDRTIEERSRFLVVFVEKILRN
ncbi:MAG: hypothetical protein ACYTF1_13990 [Planctomycetota bacterium]|jgi:hypothetical protein